MNKVDIRGVYNSLSWLNVRYFNNVMASSRNRYECIKDINKTQNSKYHTSHPRFLSEANLPINLHSLASSQRKNIHQKNSDKFPFLCPKSQTKLRSTPLLISRHSLHNGNIHTSQSYLSIWKNNGKNIAQYTGRHAYAWSGAKVKTRLRCKHANGSNFIRHIMDDVILRWHVRVVTSKVGTG